ncbi:hypothetical protein SAMN05216207_101222 [Pseudonocardia ammonioxydans]|uniref:2-keto-4-pentenoate hydratase/2-oxohepta-3-ene-1,7-dioic acid hydratase (Catechol pathway) n=1 Tax=Pseudonocardia ammonioxydans TaxID=260086 RepID=A0A1I4XWA1_PSUAM|nr:hypothetical protein [Pseudonocardia ammonioxydans]SFN30057.1 hypothetical protein SAMN05216207_101222 [Pseudonocardia ammonioxydans]
MHGPAWSLVTYHEGDVGKPRTGMLTDGVVRQVPEAIAGRPLLDVLRDWDAVVPTLHALAPEDGEVVADAVLLAPLRYPAKVLCAGANYYGHLEWASDVPSGCVLTSSSSRRRRQSSGRGRRSCFRHAKGAGSTGRPSSPW